MIVNFQYEFVFVHIPKTGGSSLTQALKKNFPDNVSRCHRICSYVGLPGFKRHLATSSETRHETYQHFVENFSERTGLAESIALKLRPIAFVRHPISRFISLHRYLLGSQRDRYPDVPEDINEWAVVVRHGQEPYLGNIRSLLTQSSFVQGMSKQQFVGRFETFDRDVERLGNLLGKPMHLPHLKPSAQVPASKKDWSVLSNYSIAFLQEAYADDFARFGY